MLLEGATLWFQLHVGLQMLALALTAAGLVSFGCFFFFFFWKPETRFFFFFIFEKNNKLTPSLSLSFLSPTPPHPTNQSTTQGCGIAIKKPTDHGRKLAHEIIGYVIFGVVAVQALAGAFRPANAKLGQGASREARAAGSAGHRVAGISMACWPLSIYFRPRARRQGRGVHRRGFRCLGRDRRRLFRQGRRSTRRKKARKGAALAEANSSTMAWKSSVVNGGGAPSSRRARRGARAGATGPRRLLRRNGDGEEVVFFFFCSKLPPPPFFADGKPKLFFLLLLFSRASRAPEY